MKSVKIYRSCQHFPRWATLFLFFLVTTTSNEIGSPPKIVKEPFISELLFKVATHQNVNDEPFVLDCEAEGEPTPKFQWEKNGKDFDWKEHKDRIFQQPGHGSLNITKPKIEDVGKYQCFATNAWGTAKSRLVTVKTEMPVDKTVKEGNPFKLDCEFPTTKPQSNILWLTVNSEGRIDTINNSRITVDPEGNLWFSNVTLNDTSNDFTYSCAVASTSADDSLRITNIKLFNKINLTVTRNEDPNFQNEHPPIQQYVTKKYKVVLKDEKVELFCIYGGTPLPKNVWLKDGTIVQPTEWVSLRNYGKSLFIQRVKFEDRGNYTCNVSNGVGSSQSYNIELDINVVPYFNVTPKDVKAAVGETAVIECDVIGFPEPKIKWIHNGQPLNETSLDSRYFVSSNSITIMTLTKNDTGIYGCNASNNVGHVYKDVHINVLALAPNITEPPSNIDIVDDGRAVIIKCKHFGMPKPHIKWVRNNEELVSERYFILDNGDLQIREVDITDSGNYTCIATNTYGTVNASGKLTVKEHTIIIAGPKDYEVIAGLTATFNCTATADSSLHLNIEWLANDELVNFGNESSRFVKTNDYSMSIIKTTESDSGTYTCLASTVLDNATASATLIVLDRPEPPELLGITCNKKDAAIKWQPKGDNHASILHYTIEYNTSHAPDNWLIGSDNVPASYRTHIVPMTPWANFTFRVVATNKIGRSDPSMQSNVCTTQTDVPHKNPDNVVAAGTDPSNLVISWTPMPQIEHNAPGFKYQVYWRQDVPGNEFWSSKEIRNYSENELVVTNQPIYQRYKVKVIAVNEKGESNAQQSEVIGYSGEDVPTDVPQNLTVLNVTGNRSAILRWKPVSNESIKGNFLGYKIKFWTEKDGENNAIIKLVNSDKTTAEITNLSYNVKYYTRITAYNSRFDGPTSKVISFDTPEGVPGPVHGVATKQWGSSSIFLTWKKPLQTNGVLTGYEISYESMTQDEDAEKTRSLNITDPNQTTVKLALLKPNTNYQIYIKATTQVGAGEPVFITQQTKPPLPEGIELDKPEFNYEHVVNNYIFDTVRISWIPKLDANPGSYFFVKYKLKGENEYKETEPEHETNVTDVKGLMPGELYEFIIVAVDGDSKKESEAVQIEASSTADPRIRKSEHMATSGWFIAVLLAMIFFVILLTTVCFVKRNKTGKYAVHESERTRGRRDYPDESHFPEYSQPLGGTKSSESDADSAEYSEDDIGMTEDGSFIGLYCKSILDETISTDQRNAAH